MATMHSTKFHQKLDSYQSPQQRPLSSRTSPTSFAPSSSPGPASTTLDTLIAEMEQMKSDFDKRLGQVVQDYEQTGSIVQKLTRDLQLVRKKKIMEKKGMNSIVFIGRKKMNSIDCE